MSVDKFTHKQVTASFRKFNDLAKDVEKSAEHSWADNVKQLFHHCENDSVMHLVMEPIVAYPETDFEAWVDARWGADNRKDVPFPNDETQLAAYQYLSLKKLIGAYNIHHEVFDLMNKIYGKKQKPCNLGNNLQFINTEIFLKFQRSVKYRLQEIEQSITGKAEVQKEALVVFHNHGTYIGGNINANGSQIAIGQSTISGSSIQNSEELSSSLKELEKLLTTVDESQREAVKESIQFLVNSTTHQDILKSQVVTAVETVSTGSQQMASFLKDIAVNAVGSLASNLIVLAIKFQFGIG